jgi:hypothetical protein
MARGDYFVNEGGPVVRPFLLQDRHKHEVEFVKECSLCLQRFFGAGALYDEADDKVSNALKDSQIMTQNNRISYLDIAPLAVPSIGS